VNSPASSKFDSVESYLDSLAPDVRTAVEEVRAIVREAVPDGEDTISYNIPTVRRDGRAVVHYAGWKKHVSLYPVPDTSQEPDDALERELAPYLAGKGTLKFPLDRPLPRELVARVVSLLSDAAR
jgi:uncharacterized protein YdhG (YjbR/CyaY superfamily)